MMFSCCFNRSKAKDDICHICYECIPENSPDIQEMRCDHSVGHFHLKCIRKWMETNIECPICKVQFELKNDTPWKKWMRQTKQTLRSVDYNEYDKEALVVALCAAKEERDRLVSSRTGLVKIHDAHIDIITKALESKVTEPEVSINTFDGT